jgi:hypothetical protein
MVSVLDLPPDWDGRVTHPALPDETLPEWEMHVIGSANFIISASAGMTIGFPAARTVS